MSPSQDPLLGEGHPLHPHAGSLALVLATVFLAGAAGTAVRLGLDLTMPASPGGVPVATLVINTVGSFALGILVAALPQRLPTWLRAGLITGLLGSFTTFSAITVAAVALGGTERLLGAAVLLAASVVAGLLAALAGMALGSRVRSWR